MRYLPDPNQIVTKYGNEGLKQYSHENKPIDLTKVYFLQLTSGSVSKNLSKDEQITLTEAALVLSRFQGNSGFEMIGVVFLCFALTYLTPLFYNTKGILYREIFGVKVNASEAPAGSHSDNDDSGDNNSNSGNGNNGSFTA